MEVARRRLLAASLAILMLTVPVGNVASGQPGSTSEDVEQAGEPAVLSHPLPRGGVEATGPVSFADTAPIAVDGSLEDWSGQATRLGGTTVLDAGELVHQGFLFDAHGPDDGKDAERIATLGPAYDQTRRAERIEALAQAADEQFGAPDPTGGVLVSPAHYGNADVPSELEGHADLVETRLTIREDTAYLAVRTSIMTDPGAPALLVLADTDPGAAETSPVPFASGLTTDRAEHALLVTDEGVWAADLAAGGLERLTAAEVAVDPSGYTNAIEASLPLEKIAQPAGGEQPARIELALAAGLHAGEGELVDVATGEAEANLLDVAFRQEPTVSNWMDREQALMLLDGRLEAFAEIPVEDLRQGKTVDWQPTPGYHERVFTSSANISEEAGREAIHQHYGLYLPSDWTPDEEHPLTFWLHWRGGTAHQAAAWTPRVVEQLAEEREPSNVLVSPRARGTSTWYAGAAHLDVLQVFEDVHDLVDVDEDRRYLSGYSMGGYGSYLFGLLYPDRFAGAFPISGAMTIGLWAGVFEDGRDTQGTNGGDGDLENTYRLVENARNLPYVIHHGTNDELVPVTGVERVAAKFAELTYPHRLYRFPGYEHFTQAVVDEWAEGADYLDEQVRQTSRPEVVYKRVPALEHAIETLNARGADIDVNADGAYWVSDVHLREEDTTDPSVHGQVEARSHAIPEPAATTPEAGAASTGHSTPYVMDGLARTSLPCEAAALCPLIEPTSNALDVSFSNLAQATVDAEAAQLETQDETLTIRLATDGPARLTVEGTFTCPNGDDTFDADGQGQLAVEPDAVTIEAFSPGTFEAQLCHTGERHQAP